MPTLVSVKMRITKVDGKPWKNGKVQFYIINGSFTNTDQFPGNVPVYIKVDNLGEGIIRLWAEDEGEIQTRYRCILPNDEYFEFNIPIPALPLYELSQLRIGGILESDPEYQSVIDYINAYLGGITDYLPTGGNTGDILKIIQNNPRIIGWDNEKIQKLSELSDVDMGVELKNGSILSYNALSNNFNLTDKNTTLIDGGTF